MLFENLLNYDNHNALASSPAETGGDGCAKVRETSTNNNKQVEFSWAPVAVAVAGARTR